MEERPSSADSRRISLWTIASTDVVAHILAWMLGVVLVGTAAVLVYWAVTGREPEESWSQFIVSVALMAAVLYGLLWWRAARVTSWLAHGVRARAKVDGHDSVGHWVRLRVSFEHSGRQVGRKVLLVWSRRTYSLKGRTELTVVVHPDDPRQVTIADLYESSAGF